MRITVDLPAVVHRRVLQLARNRGVSVSAVIADLTARGLATLGVPRHLATDPVTGLPVLSLGRRVTTEDVVGALADE